MTGSDRHLVAADDLMAPAVEETIAALDPPPQDAALVRVARMAAAEIDGLGAMKKTMLLSTRGSCCVRSGNSTTGPGNGHLRSPEAGKPVPGAWNSSGRPARLPRAPAGAETAGICPG